MIGTLRPQERIDEAEVQGGLQALLYDRLRQAVRHVSNVAGLRQQYYFPFARLEEIAQQAEGANAGKETDAT